MLSFKNLITISAITTGTVWLLLTLSPGKLTKNSKEPLLKSGVDKTLRFNQDHSFTILQFSDLHYGLNATNNANNDRIQADLIKRVKPDLVIITGDAVSGYEWDKKESGFYEKYWRQFSSVYQNLSIKYAFTLGNHDTDADLNAKQVGDLDRTHPFSLFNGTNAIDPLSYSNYNLEVKTAFDGYNNQTSALLWLFDSKNRGCMNIPDSWGCLTQNQLDWFQQTSSVYKNIDQVSFIKGLAFFHIPLVEFMDLWNFGKTDGAKEESVSCPRVNTNAFESFRMKNNIKGIFVGHDHNNDYAGRYKDIELVFCRKTGYGSYGPLGMKGARVIKLTEKVEEGSQNVIFDYSHYIIQEDGSSIEPQEPTWQGFTKFQFVCEYS
jgi:3',5'-cyclic AMP phosphodiesterase CpdA